MDDKADDIDLKKDGTISFINDRFSIKLNEDGDIAALTRTMTEPGKYELYAKIIGNITDGKDDIVKLNSSYYPSILYYDLDEDEGEETLNFTIYDDTEEINGSSFMYTTTIYQGEHNEPYIAWLGAPFYVVDKTSDFYISELLLDEELTDDYLLKVGETLTLKEGVAITPDEIDVEGKKALFTITQDGESVDSSVTAETTYYTWSADLNDSGDDDNTVLSFYVDTVFAGMNSNVVKISEVWQVSTDIVVVEDNDDETIDDYVIDINGDTLTIELDDKDDDIDLKKDGTISLLNDRFSIKLNEDGDIAAVVKIVEIVGGEPIDDVTDDVTDNVTDDVTDDVTDNVTDDVTDDVTDNVTEDVTEVPTPEPTPEPGFEAVFAVAGLLAVAYLVLRQRD